MELKSHLFEAMQFCSCIVACSFILISSVETSFSLKKTKKPSKRGRFSHAQSKGTRAKMQLGLKTWRTFEHFRLQAFCVIVFCSYVRNRSTFILLPF